MVFTLDNFGAIIIMGFRPKGGLNPSSLFHSVNAIRQNWTERITENARYIRL
jgi:hypothetical protein